MRNETSPSVKFLRNAAAILAVTSVVISNLLISSPASAGPITPIHENLLPFPPDAVQWLIQADNRSYDGHATSLINRAYPFTDGQFYAINPWLFPGGNVDFIHIASRTGFRGVSDTLTVLDSTRGVVPIVYSGWPSGARSAYRFGDGADRLGFLVPPGNRIFSSSSNEQGAVQMVAQKIVRDVVLWVPGLMEAPVALWSGDIIVSMEDLRFNDYLEPSDYDFNDLVVAVHPHPNVAICSGVSVPTVVPAGRQFDASVAFTNTGSSVWYSTAAGSGAPFRVGFRDPEDNAFFGVGRLDLSTPVTGQGGTAYASATFTAPQHLGTYPFRPGMLQEGIEWFGSYCPTTPVTVVPSNQSSCGGINVEGLMPGNRLFAGQRYYVNVTMVNPGTEGAATWGASAYRLASFQNFETSAPGDATPWGVNRVPLDHDVPRGTATTFRFPVIAPAAGSHSLTYGMVQEGVERYGAVCNLDLSVVSLPTSTPTATSTATFTSTALPTATRVPTQTATATSSVTATHTCTISPSATPTATHTCTVSSSATPTITATATRTCTVSPSDTPTATPSPSATVTPTCTVVAAKQIRPTVSCVADNGDGTFTAYFGYQNENASAVDIAVGTSHDTNSFSPGAEDRHQPTTFQSGTVSPAFSVEFDGKPLTWTLSYHGSPSASVTASTDSVACKPIIPTVECIDQKGPSTFVAHFGYKNDNAFEFTVPIGSRNGFDPPPVDRGQPTQFFSGRLVNPFTVNFDGSPLTWKVATESARADANSPYCTANQAPTCKIVAPGTVECQGDTTQVPLDGSTCADPEGSKLSYAWITDCSGGTFDDPHAQRPVLELTGPGAGQAANCSVTLTVSDGRASSSCTAPVSVSACGPCTGGLQPDQCGVCGGDGTSCVDCAGTVNGTKIVDRCGVCGGNNACVDCAGTVNGTAQVDRCGICQGDGKSCLNCVESNIMDLLLALDASGLKGKGLVLALTAKLRKVARGDTKAILFAKQTSDTAKALYTRNWSLTWTLPQIIENCENAQFCTEQDNGDLLTQYQNNAAALRDLALEVIRRIRRFTGGTLDKATRSQMVRAGTIYSDAVNTSHSVPRFQSTCQ